MGANPTVAFNETRHFEYNVKVRALPSYERLHELFTYDPITGNLIRKIRVNGSGKVGDIAASKNNGGIKVTVDYKSYLVHRIIWLMVHGYDPKDAQIDHINRNPYDNRIENLRLVSNQTNAFNRGAKGFYFNKNSKKYLAQIKVDGKSKTIGTFDCPLMARLAYEDAKKIYHQI